jgi:hypothetical protein
MAIFQKSPRSSLASANTQCLGQNIPRCFVLLAGAGREPSDLDRPFLIALTVVLASTARVALNMGVCLTAGAVLKFTEHFVLINTKNAADWSYCLESQMPVGDGRRFIATPRRKRPNGRKKTRPMPETTSTLPSTNRAPVVNGSRIMYTINPDE